MSNELMKAFIDELQREEDELDERTKFNDDKERPELAEKFRLQSLAVMRVKQCAIRALDKGQP